MGAFDRFSLAWSDAKTVVCGALLALAVALPSTARADEPVTASEPRLLSETAETTSVVDAFDEGDLFDLHLTLGFEQQWKHADVRRESTLNQPGLASGGFVAQTENIASFSEQTSLLNVGADVGLFRDLALIFRLPLVLNDSRDLSDLDGSSKNPQRLQDTNGDQLFTVPFHSPARSGVDYLSAGLAYAIFNQRRDWTKPTWVVGVEGRFGVGTPLHACNDQSPPGQPKCPDPANPSQSRDAGISRGTTGVAAHTTFSRRYGYLEPYAGFWFLAEFPHDDSDFGTANDLRGSLVNHPPLLGRFTMGTEIIPWEQRERFQRLLFDLRFNGTYHSPGREYSELFDALGSSQARLLRNPNPAGYHASADNSASVPDPAAGNVYFTGISDQQAYGSFGASGGVTFQAGEYVKFNAGLGMQFAQSHLVTTSDACNPDVLGDAGAAGPCHGGGAAGSPAAKVTGIPNPNHRDIIDAPGHRFSVDNTTIVNLWLSGVLMF